MFQNHLTARLFVKKQAQEMQLISPLERMAIAIKSDVLSFNNYDYILKAGTKAGAAKRWEGHTHEQVLAAHGYVKDTLNPDEGHSAKDYYIKPEMISNASSSVSNVRSAMDSSGGKAVYQQKTTDMSNDKVSTNRVAVNRNTGSWSQDIGKKSKEGDDALSLGKHLDKLHGIDNTNPKSPESLNVYSLNKQLRLGAVSEVTPSTIHATTAIRSSGSDTISTAISKAKYNNHLKLLAHGFSTKDSSNYTHPDGSTANLEIKHKSPEHEAAGLNPDLHVKVQMATEHPHIKNYV